MKISKLVLAIFLSLSFTAACSNKKISETQNTETIETNAAEQLVSGDSVIVPLVLSAKEWKEKLTAEQYHVLREKGTERAFTGPYWDNHESGNYYCAGCNLLLFSSKTKFDSGTGWPSFFQAVNNNAVKEIPDTSYGMTRVEVVCGKCDGHLGHVFEDGPAPTGLRYCMNGTSMTFKK